MVVIITPGGKWEWGRVKGHTKITHTVGMALVAIAPVTNGSLYVASNVSNASSVRECIRLSFVPLAFVTLKSHHTTSTKRPTTQVSGLNIPRAFRD